MFYTTSKIHNNQQNRKNHCCVVKTVVIVNIKFWWLEGKTLQKLYAKKTILQFPPETGPKPKVHQR